LKKPRITAAGATVKGTRINGNLAVSRGFGDHDFKVPHNGAKEDWVSCEPHIKVYELTQNDEFLVMACDGLWDMMKHQEVVDFVVKLKKQGKKDILDICDLLVKESLDLGSFDNVTVVIVTFNENE